MMAPSPAAPRAISQAFFFSVEKNGLVAFFFGAFKPRWDWIALTCAKLEFCESKAFFTSGSQRSMHQLHGAPRLN